MIDEAIRKRNEPTNQPNKFFFFFFGVIRGPYPTIAISREGKMGAGFPVRCGGWGGGDA